MNNNDELDQHQYEHHFSNPLAQNPEASNLRISHSKVVDCEKSESDITPFNPFELEYGPSGDITGIIMTETQEKIKILYQRNDRWIIGEKNDDQFINESRRTSEIRIKNELTEQVFIGMWYDFLYLHNKQMELETKNGEFPRTTNDSDESILDETYEALKEEAKEEVLNWFKEAEKNELQISEHHFTYQDGVGITVCRIGHQPDSGWESNIRAYHILNELQRVRDKPINRILDYIQIYEFLDFQEQVQKIHAHPKETTFYSCAANMLGTQGLVSRRHKVFIAYHGDTSFDENGIPVFSIDATFADKVRRHELAHLFDRDNPYATQIQQESFARMVDIHYDLEESIRILRNIIGYTNHISVGKIETLFNFRDTDTYEIPFPKAEVYDVTGSVNCFIYEKLGKEAFNRFYELITGSSALVEGRLVKRKQASQADFPNDLYCNFRGSLEAILKQENIELTYDDFLNQFIQKINRKD